MPAGKTVKTTAKQVRTFGQTVHLTRLDEAQLIAQSRGGALPADVVAKLKEAAGLQRGVAEAERELAMTIAARDRIVKEQKRLRDNMKPLDKQNALYKRYLEKLNTQEDELEALLIRRDDLDGVLQERQAAFEAFVAGLK